MTKQKPSTLYLPPLHSNPNILADIDRVSEGLRIANLGPEIVAELKARKKAFDEATIECRIQNEIIVPFVILTRYFTGPLGKKFTFNLSQDLYADDEVSSIKMRYRGRTLTIQARTKNTLPAQIGKHVINPHTQQEEIIWHDLPVLVPSAKEIGDFLLFLIHAPERQQIIREIIEQKKTMDKYKEALFQYFHLKVEKKFCKSKKQVTKRIEAWIQEHYGNMEGEIHSTWYIPPESIDIDLVMQQLQNLRHLYEKGVQQNPSLRVTVDNPEYKKLKKKLQENGNYDDLLAKWLTAEQVEQYLILHAYEKKINPPTT